jgi:hypothetical protein
VPLPDCEHAICDGRFKLGLVVGSNARANHDAFLAAGASRKFARSYLDVDLFDFCGGETAFYLDHDGLL